MKIDNFALTTFQSCPAKYQLRMIEGWETRRKSSALGFGGAIHLGLAEWYRTGDAGAAIKAIADGWQDSGPVDDYRTREKCVQVMVDYIKEYREEAWKVVGAPERPMIEVTFTLPTGLYLQCEHCGGEADEHGNCQRCGSPCELIEYGGIFDGLVEFSGGVYVLEHKSTSQLGEYYFNQFKPNNQVTGYMWAAEILSGMPVGGAILNAIGVYKVGATKFRRSITNRSRDDIKEWLINLRNTCQMLKDCEKRGYFPMFTPSCTMYGQCEYHSVHVLGNAEERAKRLENDYVRHVWNYEDRDD